MRILIAPPCTGKTKLASLMSNVIDGDTVPAIADVYKQMRGKWGPQWWENHVALSEKDKLMAAVRQQIEVRVDTRSLLATSETDLPAQTDQVFVVLPTVEELMARCAERLKLKQPELYYYKSVAEAEKIHAHYGRWAVTRGCRVMQDLDKAALELLEKPSVRKLGRWDSNAPASTAAA